MQQYIYCVHLKGDYGWSSIGAQFETFDKAMKFTNIHGKPEWFPYLIALFQHYPVLNDDDWLREWHPELGIETKICCIDNGIDLLYKYEKSWIISYDDYITYRYTPGGDMFKQCQEEIEKLLKL